MEIWDGIYIKSEQNHSKFDENLSIIGHGHGRAGWGRSTYIEIGRQDNVREPNTQAPSIVTRCLGVVRY